MAFKWYIVYSISCSGQNSAKFLLCSVLVFCPTPGPPHQPAENWVLRDRIIIHVQAALSPSIHYDWSFEFCSKLIRPDRRLFLSMKTVSDLSRTTTGRPNKWTLVPQQKSLATRVVLYDDSYRSSTCPLKSFFWLLSHMIYLKLKRVLSESLLSKMNEITDKIYNYTKETNLAFGNLEFWLILSFKNLQDWKVNTFLPFSVEG